MIPAGASNPGVWVEAELLPGFDTLVIGVTDGSLLEVGLPFSAGFLDSNGSYTVNGTPTAQGEFFVFGSPIPSGASAAIGDIVLSDISPPQSTFPLFLATDGTSITLTSVPAFALGDYNFNGVVDAADYTVWANTFGQTGLGLPADGNGNLTVDAADYTIWANNFGLMSASPSPVPEPSSIVLSALGLIGLLAYGWRRPRRA